MSDIRENYVGLLRGMLSPTWQKPSAHKIERLLRDVDAADTTAPSKIDEPLRAMPTLPTNRKSRAAASSLVPAATSPVRRVKEAMVDVASSGLFPVELRNEEQKIVDNIHAHLRQIVIAIELIP